MMTRRLRGLAACLLWLTAVVLPAKAGDEDDLLPVDAAFALSTDAQTPGQVQLRWRIADGYYLYRHRISVQATGFEARPLQLPDGEKHTDEFFGPVETYRDELVAILPGTAASGATQISLQVKYQGCADLGVCYPPQTRRVTVEIPPGNADLRPDVGATAVATNDADVASPVATAVAPTSLSATSDGPLAEDQRLAGALSGSKRWLTLLGFLGAGLLLAFTPCVLPMIPILSGLIAGQGTRIGTRRALLLSLVYILANALVFTVAGVVAGLLGANLQVAFQKPWVIAAFAALFVALSLSMFGLYELQLPAFLRARLGAIGDRQRGGSWWGVAAMGVLSALIVGPCVAPPLAGAVLYISQTRDPVFGGVALFLLALGMGMPLLAFGVAAGRGLPTSGVWMTAVQRGFGFVFVGLAIWMLSRILPGAATLVLYGLLALAAAAWAFSLAHPDDSARARWIAGFAGMVLAVLGAAELLGAMAGGRDPLKPLAGAFGGRYEARELPFRMIKSSQDLDHEIAAAQAAGKPLLFDFYADWCVACKEMEQYTFTEPAVHAALQDFVLLKADVTANDQTDQTLMKRFGIIGPPAMLFFADGAERRHLRLVGFEKADAFVARSERAAR